MEEYHEIPDFVNIKIGEKKKAYSVFKKPIPHIITHTKTVIHGWSGDAQKNGRRACTAERFLLNPYRGCTHRCQYPCYTCAFSSFSPYYRLFWEQNIPTVVINLPEVLANELDNPDLKFAAWGYLSPTTDSFQKPLEPHYELTYKSMKILVDRNLGFEFITKNVPSKKVVDLLQDYPYAFAQFTITSNDEKFRKIFEPGSAPYEKRFDAMREFHEAGIPVILRYDPVEPLFNDKEEIIKDVFLKAHESGAHHVIFSISDKNSRYWDLYINNLVKHSYGNLLEQVEKIYTDKQAGELHANLKYRENLIIKAHKIAKEVGLTFALCMEFIRDSKNKIYIDLNQKYKTSNNCEGMDTPLFKKNTNGKWNIVKNCHGNCLYGKCSISCGISDLKKCKALKLADWKKFSKEFVKSNNSRQDFKENFRNLDSF